MTILVAQAALADTLAGNPVLTEVSGEAHMNLWDLATKGGWIMIVLAILSIICFYIFFERLSVIRKAGKDDPLFIDRTLPYATAFGIETEFLKKISPLRSDWNARYVR